MALQLVPGPDASAAAPAIDVVVPVCNALLEDSR
jgi:hypothetical protein